MWEGDKTKTKPLNVPADEIELWRNRLIDWFKIEKGVRDPIIKASDVISKALLGWSTAPPLFENRIERLIGINERNDKLGKWGNSYKYKKYEDDVAMSAEIGMLRHIKGTPVKKEVEIRDITEKEKILLDQAKERDKKLKDIKAGNIPGMTKGTVVGAGIYQIINGEELDFWIEREKNYRREFELNDSSDEPLLYAILTEELVTRRIRTDRLINGSQDLYKSEDVMKGSYERLQKALEALGVTRKQREADNSGGKGTVAHLSVIYEEKIKNIAEIEKKKKEEEEEMMKKSAAKIPVNMIEDKEETDLIKPEELPEIIEEDTQMNIQIIENPTQLMPIIDNEKEKVDEMAGEVINQNNE